MNTDDADVQTMLRLKGGDDLALNELMGRWQSPLTGFILRYTGNEQDALDLAQETFPARCQVEDSATPYLRGEAELRGEGRDGLEPVRRHFHCGLHDSGEYEGKENREPVRADERPPRNLVAAL